jgi:hypothetical protein
MIGEAKQQMGRCRLQEGGDWQSCAERRAGEDEKADWHSSRRGGAWEGGEATVKGKCTQELSPNTCTQGRLAKDWAPCWMPGGRTGLCREKAQRLFDVLARRSLRLCIPDRISIR